MLIPLIFGENILLLLDQDPEVASLASHFINTMLPGMYLMGQLDLMRKWLICMRKPFMPMVTSLGGVFIYIPLAYLFVITAGMGIGGFGLATAITGLI